MRAGYGVDTVFGKDGVMSCESVAGYVFVLIDEACPLEDRNKLTHWLEENLPKLTILSAAYLILKLKSPGDGTAPSLRD